jgi:hypothetical protein
MKRFLLTGLVCLNIWGSIYCQISNFDLLKGQPSIEIPFNYVNNFIILKVSVNKLKSLQFIFDTGAEHPIIFKKDLADLIGLQYDRRLPIIGSDQNTDLFALVSRNALLTINDQVTKFQDVLVLEDDFYKLSEITGMNISGLIGGNYFRNYVVEFNFRRGILTIYESSKFKEPAKRYKKLPIIVSESRPFLVCPFRLSDTTIHGKFLLDTGAGLPLLVHTNSHPSFIIPDESKLGSLGNGLGGDLMGFLSRIKQIDIGPFVIRDIVSSFQDLDSIFLNSKMEFRNGIIGTQLMYKFDLIIDYINSYLYLKPNRNFKKKLEYDRSGLVLFAVGRNFNEFLVHAVMPNSPSAETGLIPGDKITKIGFFPASFFSLNTVMRKFQNKRRKKVRITIQREDEILKKEIFLRDLFGS